MSSPFRAIPSICFRGPWFTVAVQCQSKLNLLFVTLSDERTRYGLRTPNEGINQKNLKIWADDQCGKQNMLWSYLKIWEWELIFGCAVKAISSPGVRSLGTRYSPRIKKPVALYVAGFENYV